LEDAKIADLPKSSARGEIAITPSSHHLMPKVILQRRTVKKANITPSSVPVAFFVQPSSLQLFQKWERLPVLANTNSRIPFHGAPRNVARPRVAVVYPPLDTPVGVQWSLG